MGMNNVRLMGGWPSVIGLALTHGRCLPDIFAYVNNNKHKATPETTKRQGGKCEQMLSICLLLFSF